jgi:hypothetical protein
MPTAIAYCTCAQEASAHELFLALDADSSGSLSVAEVRVLLSRLAKVRASPTCNNLQQLLPELLFV